MFALSAVADLGLLLSVPPHVLFAGLFAFDPVELATSIGGPAVLAVNDLPTVISNLQSWVAGLLAGVATLFLIVAGLLYATAGGDPSQVERAKACLKSALVGYALAALAPILLTALKGILGV